jgi:tRNA threonylcarbamoyladenosine biosynthesis protein TsaE
MATLISHSVQETESIGEAWGREAKSGLVIALSGDLGAGKTVLAKGFAKGLGITERVHSPTFSLVNIYTSGRIPLFHLDLYRLETREQIAAAGLEEYFSAKGVTIIEWAERLIVARESVKLGNKLISVAARIGEKTLSAAPGLAEGSSLLRWTDIKALNETAREIDYEDFGS